MKATTENKVSMYYKVREFFSNHLSTLMLNAPALGEQVARYGDTLTELDALLMIAGESNQGYAIKKQQNRDALTDAAMVLSGAMVAYATLNNNAPLSAKCNTTRSGLDRMRDTDLLYWTERLHSLSTPVLGDLEQYGFTADAHAVYTTKLSSYRDSLQEPADRRSAAKGANIVALQKLDVIDDQLLILDALMQVQQPAHPLLYNQYLADRLIDDNASGISDPDVEASVAPNSIELLYEVPYEAGRKFALKNKSVQTIEWGLSEATDTATVPLSTLLGSSSSERLSSTLAPSGNYLIVRNPSNIAVEVELRIVE